ncbi:MAG TPA: primosomal protein N' [Blastocatellia bacterium]|nr:primosomal protein N' [Blastocatellia bacterium]
MFAEVAVPLYVHQTFTYALPESFAAQAQPGCRALVPFGRQLLTGYIVDIHNTLEEAGLDAESTEIKAVEELFDTEPLVTRELLELTKWIADYYFAPWGETIKACLPAGINAEAETMLSLTTNAHAALSNLPAKPTTKLQALQFIAANLDDNGAMNSRLLIKEFEKAKAGALIRELEKSGYIIVTRQMQDAAVKPKKQQAVKLTEAGLHRRDAEETQSFAEENLSASSALSLRLSGEKKAEPKPLNEQQQRVITTLLEAPEPLGLTQLTEAADVSTSVIKTLEKRGLVEVFVREVRRDPLAHIRNLQADELELMPQQQEALDAITTALAANHYAAFLLHGVTGSGKTEVYIRAMRAALEQGKTALMLVPEISLTPMFARRLSAHFGDAVAILHSSLSDGERLDEWNRMRTGEARICIGARSGVFAPLENLGLLIVDEEHEAAYKQDSEPRYHGRDTAIVRALKANAVVVLGSATPSMESFHNAHTGKYTYLKMDARVSGRPLAPVEVVDMREVFSRHGKQQIFSDEMKAAIAENHERGKQTLVLLNRRGFSSFLLCRSCGHKSHCPNCDVALTYHKSEARLVCHYCGHQARVPRACENCSGPYIYYVGEGTEQIEALLQELYPDMRIARLDRDTTRRRGAFEKLLGAFAIGEIDLMVGTQMIAKGHDFHNVTLVCVISVDAGLAIPDFRSAERTFQLLTQVAGRAGRGEDRGRVLLQSYHQEHYALEYAQTQV